MKRFMKGLGLMVLFLSGFFPLQAEDVLLHAGPTVETPESIQESPFPMMGERKVIRLRHEFFLSREAFAALPYASNELEEPPLSATEAIGLAQKSVNQYGEARSLRVTELKFLRGPAGQQKEVDFYLISMLVNGSEEHRVVLMNRVVLGSRLRAVKE
jgi:hypothetical protein